MWTGSWHPFKTVWRCGMKCPSITRHGTIQVLQEDPCSDWNFICVGLGLLPALLLTWHCQKSNNDEEVIAQIQVGRDYVQNGIMGKKLWHSPEIPFISWYMELFSNCGVVRTFSPRMRSKSGRDCSKRATNTWINCFPRFSMAMFWGFRQAKVIKILNNPLSQMCSSASTPIRLLWLTAWTFSCCCAHQGFSLRRWCTLWFIVAPRREPRSICASLIVDLCSVGVLVIFNRWESD